MRIILDLQGAQAENAQRGIGYYSLSLAKAIIDNRDRHEILIVLSGLMPDTAALLRKEFSNILPISHIYVWNAPSPVAEINPDNHQNRIEAELLREAFLASLNPDIIHISSLFEGLTHDAVTSIGFLSKRFPVAVTLYDLIPFIEPKRHLSDPRVNTWYQRKIDHLRRASLLLAISESSRQESINYLGFSENQVTNISAAIAAHFCPIKLTSIDKQALYAKFNLSNMFIMYTGGIDNRKNVDALIRAFALLPKNIIEKYQLVIVCSILSDAKVSLEALAKSKGLNKDRVIFTGFVDEEDLVKLYNSCELFVFPSLHEGFGLPILEAMQCGAPVIGSNVSSIPEVIGCSDALFDPYSDTSIADKIKEVLTDKKLRRKLIDHGFARAKKFSWDNTGKLAIKAFESLHEAQGTHKVSLCANKRLKLAYISPLPPDCSGIANYSAELLPELSRFYAIDVIVTNMNVEDAWINACCEIRSVKWFKDNAEDYDRILYHFGNSSYHEHMFSLINNFTGVVVLHDFFLSGIQAHREIYSSHKDAWNKSLYESHGYEALQGRFYAEDTADIVFKYPCNFEVLRQATGVITHSSYSQQLAVGWYGKEIGCLFKNIPLLRSPSFSIESKSLILDRLGIHQDALITCSFGLLGGTKQNHRLLNAWMSSSLSNNKNSKLIFVGRNSEDSPYGKELIEKISASGKSNQVIITGWVTSQQFQEYLQVAEIAVQLRTASLGETSAAVLDCMKHGIPTIINANGSMAEISNDAVYMLKDEFTDQELVNALQLLYKDHELRKTIGRRAKEIISTEHNPRRCAERYFQEIESFYSNEASSKHKLVSKIKELNNGSVESTRAILLAKCIARNMPDKKSAKQIFIDVSELVNRDSRSGIQRVVRSMLAELIKNPPDGYRVEPVYATNDHVGYFYARKFTLRFLECPDYILDDEPIDTLKGDIFLGLDYQPHIVPRQLNFYRSLKDQGIATYFVTYDLLSLLMPSFFGNDSIAIQNKWLDVVMEATGSICISKSVANEFVAYTMNHKLASPCFKVDFFHLGADIQSSKPTVGMPEDANSQINYLENSYATFLLVGTIEPRKGYKQALAAFERLWLINKDVNLVIVGKQGWEMEAFIKMLRNHAEFNKHLFWLEGISDEHLEQIYKVADCLIAASEGEGFGLPLIEAAQHELPIIARDIPVFHEVAGEHAYYFSGLEAQDLANAVESWLILNSEGKAPQSTHMPYLTWAESAQQLLSKILPKE
ncbi:mannosyltransferase A [Gammaproteobacteria bacterium]|nr:mannosyltransferase A [Gammaproteobacteria bacterium]